jgi:hypothetical protein
MYSSKYEEQERVLIVDSVNENILVCDDKLKMINLYTQS